MIKYLLYIFKEGPDGIKEERRFSLNKGIVGHVIRTGHLVNLKSVKDHSAFDPAVDVPPGVECKLVPYFL